MAVDGVGGENPLTVRFVRMTLTSPSSSWWSVADARAYVER